MGMKYSSIRKEIFEFQSNDESTLKILIKNTLKISVVTGKYNVMISPRSTRNKKSFLILTRFLNVFRTFIE